MINIQKKFVPLLIVIFVLLVFNTNTFGLIENLDGGKQITDADISACTDSILRLDEKIEAQKTKDQKDYDDAMTTWKLAKTNFENTFAASPEMWPVCDANVGLCPPINWFDKHPRSGMVGHDIPGGGGNLTHPECLRKCRNNPICDFAIMDSPGGLGTCYLKSLSVVPDNNFTAGIKTSNGFRIKDNVNGYHTSFDLKNFIPSASVKNCEDICAADDKCAWFTYGKSSKMCNTRHIGAQHTGNTQYYRKKTPTIDFSENHSFIENSDIGPKPKRRDFDTPIPATKLICQDCSQDMKDINTADSTDVVVDQMQQCIATMEEQKIKQGPSTGGMTSSGSSGSSGSLNDDSGNGGAGNENNGGVNTDETVALLPSTTDNTSTNIGTSNQTLLLIIAGIVVVCVISVLMVFIMKKN